MLPAAGLRSGGERVDGVRPLCQRDQVLADRGEPVADDDAEQRGLVHRRGRLPVEPRRGVRVQGAEPADLRCRRPGASGRPPPPAAGRAGPRRRPTPSVPAAAPPRRRSRGSSARRPARTRPARPRPTGVPPSPRARRRIPRWLRIRRWRAPGSLPRRRRRSTVPARGSRPCRTAGRARARRSPPFLSAASGRCRASSSSVVKASAAASAPARPSSGGSVDAASSGRPRRPSPPVSARTTSRGSAGGP